ncbi:aminotransferase class I/II-fold pyridoxal phosphate-dependent enzyme [Clostridiisalibacter paucivorans]|uniref:methionine gamma-lyase family protein n=1 Tax=Clostridiisalibacter paucivorans TaxID=408753 RepID=UPI00047D0798|nr:aminotransferase class V-fold PLP-dependent enzyme [Clostridiisalibacter paucivorans]
MNEFTIKLLCKQFDLDKYVISYINEIEKKITQQFNKIDSIKELNQYKIISSMQRAKLDDTHFNWTTGYGYDDVGREKVEEIFSYIFNTEDALVRPTIVSGTHALTLTLSGILRPGDEMISAAGAPYDTLQKVIGIKGNEPGNLKEYGINYKEVPLTDHGEIDLDLLEHTISEKTKLILIQRSTGYSTRKALTIKEIENTIRFIKSKYNNIVCMVDNCYGEFVEELEPTDVGADIMAGSLIKNPGGGLALSGGYIVGKKDLVTKIANRSTAPGIGKECGLTFGTTRTTLQGLFLSPHTVSEALKGAVLVAATFEKLGFEVIPNLKDKRSDIIQGIQLNTEERVVAFCQGIQSASPVDSYVTPIPWDMPGYESKVIMAAGAFVQGSSIELSADAPIRKPFMVYFQGGLVYEHCKLGLLKAVDKLYKNKLIEI